jgi:cytochrome b
METENEVTVWDGFVRLFHWTLVAAFAVAYLSEEERLGLHVWAGYLVFSLVLLRLVWGFIGSERARFRDFVFGPGQVLGYLKGLTTRRAPRYVGHNPAGGAMIVALLVALLATTALGMLMFGAHEGSGPLGALAAALGLVGEQAAESLEPLHEFFANLTVVLVVVHVAGVAFGSLLHRENLVRAMVTGRKRA